MICETRPLPLARRRGRGLDPDLQPIVFKALEKEPRVGAGHVEVARSLFGLAAAIYEFRSPGSAVPHSRRALEILERAPDAGGIDLAPLAGRWASPVGDRASSTAGLNLAWRR